MRHYTPISLRSFEGHTPTLGERVLIDPSAVVLGRVVLEDDVSVWPQVAIRGDMHLIRVGARTSVQDGSVLHITHAGPYNPAGWPLDIGCDVTIGHNATLHGCTIGDRVLVGMAATVMDGVVVEAVVVIAAGALITPGKQLRSGFLYAGTPARGHVPSLTPQNTGAYRPPTTTYSGVPVGIEKETGAGVDPGLYGCIAALVWVLHRNGIAMPHHIAHPRRLGPCYRRLLGITRLGVVCVGAAVIAVSLAE